MISSRIVVVGIVLFFLIPSIVIIRSLIDQIAYAYEVVQPLMPEIMDRILPYIPIVKDETLKDTVISNLRESGKVIITYLSFATGNVLSIIFQLAVSIIVLFFIFKDGEDILVKIRTTTLIPHRYADVFIKEAGVVIRAVIYGIILTAMIQGILGGIGFWLLGLPAPVLFGTIMFILAIIPFIGTPIVWFPASLWLLYNGMIGKGIFLIIWGLFVVSMIDNFLKPYFISKRLGFHMLLTFIWIVGGMMAFGLLGIFLGPFLLAITIRLLATYLRLES